MKDMNRHKNAVHYGMKIKWNSRKYKEKKGQVKKERKPKAEVAPESNYIRKKNNPRQVKLEESNVTYIETVETSGEEIISMESLEGSTVILENGTVSFYFPLFPIPKTAKRVQIPWHSTTQLS